MGRDRDSDSIDCQLVIAQGAKRVGQFANGLGVSGYVVYFPFGQTKLVGCYMDWGKIVFLITKHTKVNH